MRYPAILTKHALNAPFCDLSIFNLGILVNERLLNNRWEYCDSLGLGMWLIFALFNITLLFRGSLWDLHGFISGRSVGLIFLVLGVLTSRKHAEFHGSTYVRG